MPDFSYDSLQTEYGAFQCPIIIINVGGKDLATIGPQFSVSDVIVDSTCGYEAAMATFFIRGLFDETTASFDNASLAKVIKLGLGCKISFGYADTARTVFCGYVTHIDFCIESSTKKGIKVSCMDIKAAMMSTRLTRQFADCKCYSEAVTKICENYEKLQKTKPPAITKLSISDTPDKPKEGGDNKETAYTIEMTDESEYEFCVKAARKFNFEFFSYAGEVVFRPAKDNKDILIGLSFVGVQSFELEYTNVGITSEIEVKSINPGDGKLISASVKNPTKEAVLVPSSKRVFIDPTVSTEEEAKYRANYLMEENSYKHCTLRVTMIGLPEITPGRFIKFRFSSDGGDEKYRSFYVHSVEHRFDGLNSYTTTFVARSCNSLDSGE